jgi:outer membrane immunogenic protein
MKRLIMSVAVLSGLASSAMAADMAVKARPVPVDPPYSWTGLYVGANIGYSWGNADVTANFFNNVTGVLLATGTGSFDMNGFIGGLQAGYNWQSGPFVLGIEADIQASAEKGGVGFFCGGLICSPAQTAIPIAAAPVTASINHHLDWFGTLRARAGFTVTPRILAYVTGGLAYGHIETDGLLTGFNALGVATATSFSGSSWEWGWTIGGGIEAHLGGNWTAKVEYLYMDLGSISHSAVVVNAPPIRGEFNTDITDHILRVGLNYKFGGGPVVARY